MVHAVLVELLHLFLSDMFSGVKMVKNALAAGAPPRTPLDSLDPLAILRGNGKGKGRDGTMEKGKSREEGAKEVREDTGRGGKE